MMEIIAYAATSYLVVQVVVVLANLFTWPVLRKSSAPVDGRISILIPARNEAGNIGNLLGDLSMTDPRVVEILVYDDDSSDNTSEIVRQMAIDDARIRYMKGEGPLPGWLGKNHACHELARAAKGEYLLFLDADVRVLPSLVDDSLSFVVKQQLDLLSIFPVQRMNSLGEWLTVPLMNRILLGNLFLILIRLFRSSDFSAANGQFMMFRVEVYKENWYHEIVKDEKVEDIRIMRLMKQQGLKTQTLLGKGQVSCRMYRGFGHSISGFSKNIHAFFGRRWLVLYFYVFFTVFGPFAVFYSLPREGFINYIAGQAMVIITVSALSRQHTITNLLLYIPQQLSLVIISIIALYRQMTGNLYWKGRRIG